jgi:uncharacterized membrane protein YqjE
MALVCSRLELVKLEAKETAKHQVRRVIAIVAAAVCVLFGWALLLAGGIVAIAHGAGWEWQWLTLGVAVAHLLGAFLLVLYAVKSSSPAFPYTRAEFQKDREWIKNFQTKPRSPF